ncbi:hypothetical protein PR202_gb18029 [Eleusine coracana subsp. coracana]|uniref:Pentatricopeptide repeat-containing protein n=1 Tax=Eleusine coracana subsp. coracana TaxID=191504 RepID=A0AAV5F3W7_ELECO|nr:hypothetical protein PR202_gb18029 [Eleusine coracana subsp. coracana]
MATRVKDVARRSTKKYVEEALYQRLFRKGSAPQAVREEVDGFLDSRKRAFKWEVGVCVRRMRRQELYRPALKSVIKQSAWILLPNQEALLAAEKYFLDLPETSKTHLTYGALLNCYCREQLTEKAEALMQKMKELNFAFTAMSYNSLMSLYTKINQPEKVPRALAAREDIPGVERVIEEMKRDGRVTPDWTTYKGALKELEKRNTSNDLEAYQFLITLYGRTQKLVEVHRVWRSLKRNCPRNANMSYLNMIQVLANLKDLPAAEACFKEWEARHIHPPNNKTKDSAVTMETESSTDSPNNQTDAKGTKDKGMETQDLKHPKYDIRVANAMIKAYIAEGMLDKAIALKKRAKMRGGRLNAKTWEIFMEHYLKEGDLKMAHWCADRAIKKGHSNGRIWVPPREVTERLMVYFELNKDVDGAEKFVETLKKVQKDLGSLVFEPLIRTYASAGKKFPGMRHRLKIENVEVSEEIDSLLDSICMDE